MGAPGANGTAIAENSKVLPDAEPFGGDALSPPLSPLASGVSVPALPQIQSRLGRSASTHGRQRSGGWTALSGPPLHSVLERGLLSAAQVSNASMAMRIVEWRMPGLPRPGSMLGGMIGVKVAIQKTSTEYLTAGADDDDEASNSLVRAES